MTLKDKPHTYVHVSRSAARQVSDCRWVHVFLSLQSHRSTAVNPLEESIGATAQPPNTVTKPLYRIHGGDLLVPVPKPITSRISIQFFVSL